MIFREPSAFCSPTTTQIFEVPISRPAMMLVSSNMFGTRYNGATTRAHTSGAGRFEEPIPRNFGRGEWIKIPLQKLSTHNRLKCRKSY